MARGQCVTMARGMYIPERLTNPVFFSSLRELHTLYKVTRVHLVANRNRVNGACGVLESRNICQSSLFPRLSLVV